MEKEKSERRYPRLAKDYPELAKHVKMTVHQRLALQAAKGIVPPRYKILTRRQKKVARLVLSGMAVRDACNKVGMDTNTFYRLVHFHPKFKKYYYSIAERQTDLVETRLDSKLPRAVRLVEEALDSRDPYFATETAVTLLKGRGKFKQSSQTKQEFGGTIKIDGKVESINSGNKDMALAFIEAMGRMSAGAAPIKPDIIDIKALPEAEIEALRASSQVQDGEQRAAVAGDK
jgi:hypothetical protein